MTPLLELALGLSALTFAGSVLWDKLREERGYQVLVPMLTRLEDEARASRVAAAQILARKELTSALAKVDHDQLIRVLAALKVNVKDGNETGMRLECAANGVADDLAASHARADAVDGPHGASADSFSRSEDEVRTSV